MNPIVSIITPCYNSAQFLERTYRSLESQTFENWEWIITDDCSTDDSLQILKGLQEKDSRIRIFSNPTNSGAAVSRNTGLDQAIGEYVAFLDADDWWEVEKLKMQVEFMKDIGANFSFHSYRMIRSNDEFVRYVNAPAYVALTDLYKFNPICTSTVMIRRAIVHKIRFRKELRKRQDYVFWFDIFQKGEVARSLSDVLANYSTGNAESLSANKIKNAKIQFMIYRKYFKLGFLSSLTYTGSYMLNGVKKYWM